MTAEHMSVLGIVLNTVGVIMLFFFGMPFRVTFNDGEALITESIRPDEKRRDMIYRQLGNLGLILILAGSGFQIGAVCNA